MLKEISEEFKKKLPEIIIVDDGSTDQFHETIIKKKIKKIKIILNKKNLGKCRAMETGIKEANNNLVCIIDGDGQNPPYEIRKLIDSGKRSQIN